MDKYSLERIVGQGSYGKAFLCYQKSTREKYIIKQISMKRMNKKQMKQTEQESCLLSKLNHPNIVKFIESFTNSNCLFIVMEYADNGDLNKFIQNWKVLNKLIPEVQILNIFVQITLALKHIHDRKILHRDLKSENIFLTTKGICKLGDFGVSRLLKNTGELAATQIGTPYYMSPEIMLGQRYNNKTDIWSLGVIFYELLCLRLPFEGTSIRSLSHNIMNAHPKEPSGLYSPGVKQLLYQMLSKSPKSRPGCTTVLSNQIIKDIVSKLIEEFQIQNEFYKQPISNPFVHHDVQKPAEKQLSKPPITQEVEEKCVLVIKRQVETKPIAHVSSISKPQFVEDQMKNPTPMKPVQNRNNQNYLEPKVGRNISIMSPPSKYVQPTNVSRRVSPVAVVMDPTRRIKTPHTPSPVIPPGNQSNQVIHASPVVLKSNAKTPLFKSPVGPWLNNLESQMSNLKNQINNIKVDGSKLSPVKNVETNIESKSQKDSNSSDTWFSNLESQMNNLKFEVNKLQKNKSPVPELPHPPISEIPTAPKQKFIPVPPIPPSRSIAVKISKVNINNKSPIVNDKNKTPPRSNQSVIQKTPPRSIGGPQRSPNVDRNDLSALPKHKQNLVLKIPKIPIVSSQPKDKFHSLYNNITKRKTSADMDNNNQVIKEQINLKHAKVNSGLKDFINRQRALHKEDTISISIKESSPIKNAIDVSSEAIRDDDSTTLNIVSKAAWAVEFGSPVFSKKDVSSAISSNIKAQKDAERSELRRLKSEGRKKNAFNGIESEVMVFVKSDPPPSEYYEKFVQPNFDLDDSATTICNNVDNESALIEPKSTTYELINSPTSLSTDSSDQFIGTDVSNLATLITEFQEILTFPTKSPPKFVSEQLDAENQEVKEGFLLGSEAISTFTAEFEELDDEYFEEVSVKDEDETISDVSDMSFTDTIEDSNDEFSGTLTDETPFNKLIEKEITILESSSSELHIREDTVEETSDSNIEERILSLMNEDVSEIKDFLISKFGYESFERCLNMLESIDSLVETEDDEDEFLTEIQQLLGENSLPYLDLMYKLLT